MVLFFSSLAKLAIEKLNHTSLNGKPIRVMWSHRDPDARKSGIGNLFVKVCVMRNICVIVQDILFECSLSFIYRDTFGFGVCDMVLDIFMQNLDESIDNVKLHEMFGKFGNIMSCKVVTFQDGKSRGYGFVQFETEESANAAIDNVNGTMVGGKQMYAQLIDFFLNLLLLLGSYAGGIIQCMGLSILQFSWTNHVI